MVDLLIRLVPSTIKAELPTEVFSIPTFHRKTFSKKLSHV